MSLGPCLGSRGWAIHSLLDATATMNAYDSIERGVVDEGERRRPRTFTLTQLLVACVAVSCCTLAATTVVDSHRGLANFGDPGTEAIKQQYEDVMKKQAEAVKAAASRYEAMIKQAEHIEAMEKQAEAIREAKEAEAMEKQAEAIRKHMEAMKKQAEAKAAADKETGPENAEKKRKAEEKERECDRQATEKKNQCLAQPALGSSPAIDGVHTTSFALGALVACTLGVVAYLVRRSRITKITDSSAYGATTVK